MVEFTNHTATFSPTKTHRYKLSRRWGEGRTFVNWIMLNPSTADEDKEDPTIRRCIDWSERLGYEGVEITNLFALRSTDPRVLLCAPDPIGDANQSAIVGTAIASALVGSPVVCAWGVLRNAFQRNWAYKICTIISSHGVQLHVLLLSDDGYPVHPLYQPKHLTFTPWETWSV